MFIRTQSYETHTQVLGLKSCGFVHQLSSDHFIYQDCPVQFIFENRIENSCRYVRH